MPLKHATETLLVAILAFVLVCTGFIVSSLPSIPKGAVPWGISIVCAVLYPVLLYPLFKRDRADHTFRMLHWMPAFILLVWMALELVVYYVPAFSVVRSAYTWSWTLPMVTAIFVWLTMFCFKVLRQWSKRVAWMLLFFVPYAVFGIWSSAGPAFEKTIASMLWNGWWIETLEGDNPNMIASSQGSSDANSAPSSVANLEKSSNASEQEWRDKLLAVDNRSSVAESSQTSSLQNEPVTDSSSSPKKWFGWLWGDKEEDSSSSITSSSSDRGAKLIEGSQGQEKHPKISQADSAPARLPQSGFGWGVIVLTMMAGYCGKVHDRQKKHSLV